MRTRTARHGAAALLLAATGIALAACGNSDDSSSAASSSSPAATASSPASTGSASPTTGSSGTASGSATGGSATAGGTTSDATSGTAGGGSTVPACATDQLKTTTQGMTSGAGSTEFELVFQNTGSSPCTLHGYPGVSFVKIHNTQLGKAASRTGGATPVVTLIPDAHAYADVRTVNGQGGYSAAQCDLTTVPTLRVYPPNQTESTNIPWNTEECVGPSVQNLRVGPVHGNR